MLVLRAVNHDRFDRGFAPVAYTKLTQAVMAECRVIFETAVDDNVTLHLQGGASVGAEGA